MKTDKKSNICPECKNTVKDKKQFCKCGFNFGYWKNTGKKKPLNTGTYLPYTKFI